MARYFQGCTIALRAIVVVSATAIMVYKFLQFVAHMFLGWWFGCWPLNATLRPHSKMLVYDSTDSS